MRLSIFWLSLAVLFTGCKEIEINDGGIPQAYLAQAQQLAGDYKGTLNHVQTTLRLSFNGTRPVLTVLNENNNDLLGPNCGSRITDLLAASAREHEGRYEVESTTFKFDANNCPIWGEEIKLEWLPSNKEFTATLAHDLQLVHVCQPNPYRCSWQWQQRYLFGTFERIEPKQK